ncbi:MAG: hypothetical protein NWE80_02105 [Candidatus Bathyarchaeota archaeon]|nr:hypothetical protein [Candidatus Bathyarchaeota archaeon]
MIVLNYKILDVTTDLPISIAIPKLNEIAKKNGNLRSKIVYIKASRAKGTNNQSPKTQKKIKRKSDKSTTNASSERTRKLMFGETLKGNL